jgi:hypothetical protein
MRLALALAVGLAAGCNQILGIGDLRSVAGDATPATADAPIDAAVDAAPPSDVDGTAIDRYVGATTAMLPEDLTGYTIIAYVPDGHGGFTTIAGAGTKTGTFHIPQVPAGPYYLFVAAPASTLPPPTFYDVTTHAPELGMDRVGRGDGPQVTQSTSLDFQLSGMTPYQANDVGDVVSFDDAVDSYPLSFGGTPGDTTTDLGVDWDGSAWYTPAINPLLQSGEDVWALHYQRTSEQAFATVPIPYIQFQLVDVYTTTAVGLTDGVAKTVTGAFTKLAPSKSQAVQLQAAQFSQGLDVTPDQPMAFLFRRRAGHSDAVGLDIYGVLSFSAPSVLPENYVPMGGLYSDPFPAGWVHYTFDYQGLGWMYRTRGTRLPAIYTSAWTFQRRPAIDDLIVTPFGAAPHSIEVGGVLASHPAAIPFDGSHAVDVTWAAVPGIEHYLVTAMQLADAGSQGALSTVAVFETSGTAVHMPASLFTVGASYVISVADEQQGGVDFPGGQLRRSGFPRATREAVTARLLFASSCGDGAVDAAYEDCDSSGVATAMCNADCSKAMCGDAIPNSAAGEQCDTAGDSVTCDSDCTSVMCGDGHLNKVAGEACDQGAMNGAAGGCCTTQCQYAVGHTSCP